MALLLKCGAIFLHIPKTGGSWVTEVLEDQGLVSRRICHIHADLHQVLRYQDLYRTVGKELSAHLKAFLPLNLKRRINRTLGQNTNEVLWPGQSEQVDRTPYIFCFVRHPVGWYESIWRYLSKWNWPNLGNPYDINDWHPKSLLNGLGNSDFNQFMRNVLAKRPGYVTEMYGWYTLPGVNFVGKQERLVDDLVLVLKELNVRFDEERMRSYRPINVTRKKADQIVWDQVVLEEVLQLEAAALKRYGYRCHKPV